MIVNCSNCNKKTSLLNDRCEHCGIKVKSCPECGNIMKETQEICDYCGYSFESIKTEEKVEKNNDEVPKELKKTAVKLASFAEKENKKYNLISRILSATGGIMCLMLMVIILIISVTKDVPFSVFESAYNVFMLLSVITIYVGCLFKELRMIFSSHAIIRQMEMLKFDYKKYYSYDNAYKNITRDSLNEDVGELQLVTAIMYKENSSKKTTKILKQLVVLFCYFLTGLFGYVGLTHGSSRSLISFLNISLNIWPILCLAFYILTHILKAVFDRDKEEAGDYIEQLRKQAK